MTGSGGMAGSSAKGGTTGTGGASGAGGGAAGAGGTAGKGRRHGRGRRHGNRRERRLWEGRRECGRGDGRQRRRRRRGNRIGGIQRSGRGHPADGLELVEHVPVQFERDAHQADRRHLRLERHAGGRIPIRQFRRLLDGWARFEWKAPLEHDQVSLGYPRARLLRSRQRVEARYLRNPERHDLRRPLRRHQPVGRRRQQRSRDDGRADVRVVGRRLPQVRQVHGPAQRLRPDGRRAPRERTPHLLQHQPGRRVWMPTEHLLSRPADHREHVAHRVRHQRELVLGESLIDQDATAILMRAPGTGTIPT